MKRSFLIIALLMVALWSVAAIIGDQPAQAQEGDIPEENQQGEIIVLRGEITKNMTLKAKKRYLLEGGVFVRAGATLKIKPGTTIFAGERSFLVIDRGAKIIAKGKANKPIIFTSAQDVGKRKRGDWGGLILNGFAPINAPSGEADGEGGTGKYGGKNPDDNSGILQFVRVEFAGFPLTPTNELNGIAFQGVGRGSIVENIEIIESGDDAMEFFGGTVNVKRILLIGAMDDGFDWTGGWQGKAQFVIIQQDGSIEANNGIEADNDQNNNDLEPRSKPTLFNFTILGDAQTKTGSSIGMLLRVGTAGRLVNFIVQNYKDVGVRIKDQSTINQLNSGSLSLESIIFFNNQKGSTQFQNNDGSSAGDLSGLFRGVRTMDPLLTSPFSKDAPNFRPQAGSPALDGPFVIAPPSNDPFFEKVTFIGGMGPDAKDDWTKGWTSFRRN
ncbi:MAG: hypothetical protein AB1489_35785 [Acidobacteriota bacterium]